MTIASSGSTPLFLTADYLLEAALGRALPAEAQVQGNGSQLAKKLGRGGIIAAACPVLAHPGLPLHEMSQQAELPRRPMLGGIGQQCVPGEQTHVGRDGPQMEWMMMNGLEGGLEADRPAQVRGPPAEVHILVIQEEITVHAAELVQTFPSQEEAAAGHPRYPAPTAERQQMVFTAGARQRQPGQRLQQRWERAGRKLAGAIAVAQLKTDDARIRLFDR